MENNKQEVNALKEGDRLSPPSFRAEPISNLRGGDTIVVYHGGPIARVKAGVRLNHGPSLKPKRSCVGGLGFIECIVHNMPSGDKVVWDVKHF
jgi:hypothetical protein